MVWGVQVDPSLTQVYQSPQSHNLQPSPVLIPESQCTCVCMVQKNRFNASSDCKLGWYPGGLMAPMGQDIGSAPGLRMPSLKIGALRHGAGSPPCQAAWPCSSSLWRWHRHRFKPKKGSGVGAQVHLRGGRRGSVHFPDSGSGAHRLCPQQSCLACCVRLHGCIASSGSGIRRLFSLQARHRFL